MTDTRTLAAFIRARLEDHAIHAGDFHDDGTHNPRRRCASLEYRGPCDCGEPNRRRRRAFTHGNIVDWYEQVRRESAVPSDVHATMYGVAFDMPLRCLAAEWSDHPDYDTEWAP